MSSSVLAQTASTPVKQTTIPAATDSPGNWKHPRLAEITRRQSQNVFSEKNIRQIVYNAVALVSVGLLRQVVLPFVPSWAISPVLKQYSSWITATLILVPLINIVFALLPLYRPQDDLSDIPLTPAQRKLLGLPPSSRPATPNSVYSTPPRYSRTPSLAGSPASIKSYTSSPLSNMASPGSGQYSSPRFGTSPSKLNAPQYSPSTVSPLLHKAMGGGRTTSFGSTSPLNASTASSGYGDGPGTPTPATGKRSTVSLNNKWLYEKGRRGSGSNWLHS
ncbi:nuclear pore complex component-domain-containing protein [Parachaetomium inaequale]|uniref:Nuclear pore complex component-domain-containing protein n=1 Tax=Parachaetomium inaequale TaxID=2588326 RepID=A0AAN6SKD8_9PEZI|nr:nuclear pore complex component-domain-containing protein [Parachaetomium inaequale]